MIAGGVYRELTLRLHRTLCRDGAPYPHSNPAPACVRAARIACETIDNMTTELAAVAGLARAAREVDRAWDAYIESEEPVDVPAEAIGALRAALFEFDRL